MPATTAVEERGRAVVPGCGIFMVGVDKNEREHRKEREGLRYFYGGSR
jgi:hypothetical protein